MNEDNNEKKQKSFYIPICTVIGIAIGLAFKQFAMGLAVGLIIGVIIESFKKSNDEEQS